MSPLFRSSEEFPRLADHLAANRHRVQNWQEAQGLAQQQAFLDILYLHRNNPLMKSYIEAESMLEPDARKRHQTPARERLVQIKA